MDGVVLSILKQIPHPLGDVYHVLKQSEDTFAGFGEAYFTSVSYRAVKGWKKHSRMTLNLVVPVGQIRFVIFDDREDSQTRGEFFEVEHSPANYQRLIVAPGLWMAFQGIGQESNLLLNIADIEHDPQEARNRPLDEIRYAW